MKKIKIIIITSPHNVQWHKLNNISLRETSWISLDQGLRMLMENSSKVYGPMSYRCAHIKGAQNPISNTCPFDRNGINNTQLFTQFLSLMAKNHLS